MSGVKTATVTTASISGSALTAGAVLGAGAAVAGGALAIYAAYQAVRIAEQAGHRAKIDICVKRSNKIQQSAEVKKFALQSEKKKIDGLIGSFPQPGDSDTLEKARRNSAKSSDLYRQVSQTAEPAATRRDFSARLDSMVRDAIAGQGAFPVAFDGLRADLEALKTEIAEQESILKRKSEYDNNLELMEERCRIFLQCADSVGRMDRFAQKISGKHWVEGIDDSFLDRLKQTESVDLAEVEKAWDEFQGKVGAAYMALRRKGIDPEALERQAEMKAARERKERLDDLFVEMKSLGDYSKNQKLFKEAINLEKTAAKAINEENIELSREHLDKWEDCLNRLPESMEKQKAYEAERRELVLSIEKRIEFLKEETDESEAERGGPQSS